ncbi:Major facilitator sugar transporter-like [Arabidopsis suecica]|uniref:Major facilitator sugar transporter-like n=1 Tax=Arabidopsis suecica TaxID=45249 RepID=A0A8T2CGX2_ARASU|nr:Major facilitator sugar transporter-like [Arabidopsis suecica]
MAVGSMNVEEGTKAFPAKLTGQVFLCCVIAAVGGLMFGYDIGISGGVTSMDTFLLDFFPHVYEKKHRVHENNYCKFDDQLLQLFTSSLYLAGIFASFISSYVSRAFGRKPTIMLASIFFLVGAILNLSAQELGMLIGGRILLGFGIGFGNQTVPLFISEIAPARYRGGLNVMFQFLITIGILAASYVNYLTSTLRNGWRYSLGGAAVPALILLIGSFFIHETPASLIERGKDEKGKQVLRKIRGIEDIELEFNEIKYATEVATKVKSPFKELFTKSENRPPLVCGTLLQFFQQFTGINVVMFYAPVLFQTMGSGDNASLISTVVTNGVNAIATVISLLVVDFAGRRCLLMEGALQMTATQMTIGGILLAHLKLVGPITGHAVPLIVLILICVYVSGFAWSWGPLGWLVPSEIYPLEVRNAGYFCAVAMNMVCTFIIGQFFLSALCRFRSLLFFFFGIMNIIMGLFVVFFLPETKGVPIEEMAEKRWKTHPRWKKYFKD